jgi:hypothetical protein
MFNFLCPFLIFAPHAVGARTADEVVGTSPVNTSTAGTTVLSQQALENEIYTGTLEGQRADNDPMVQLHRLKAGHGWKETDVSVLFATVCWFVLICLNWFHANARCSLLRAVSCAVLCPYPPFPPFPGWLCRHSSDIPSHLCV